MTQPESGKTIADLSNPAPARPALNADGTPMRPAETPLRVWLCAAIIVFAGAGAFSAALGVPFHFEDRLFVSENSSVHQIATVQEAFGSTDAGPVVWLLHALNWKLAPGSAPTFHAANLALHLLNALLVYFITRVFIRPGETEALPWLPMVAGLLFALHPLATESVNLVVGRSALLAVTFCLGAVLAFLYMDTASTTRRIACVIAVFLCVALALGTHRIALLLPLLILAADWCKVGAGMTQRLALHGILIAMSVGTIFATAFGHAGVSRTDAASPMHLDPELPAHVAVARAADLSINRRSLSAVQSAELDSIVVTFAGSAVENFESTNVIPGLALVALAMVGGAAGMWFRHPIGLGLCWYAAAVIVGAIWARAGMPFSERAVYPALAGLTIAAAGGLTLIGGRQRVRVAVGACVVLLLVVCSVASFTRSRAWLDEQTIWELARDRAARSAVPYHRLAVLYAERGDEALLEAQAFANAGESVGAAAAQQQSRDAFSKSAEFAQAAIANGANELPIRVLLGRAHRLSGNVEEAEPVLLDVLRDDPNNRDAVLALASVYNVLANTTGERQMFVRAADLYERAIAMAPPSYDELAMYARVLLANLDLSGAQAAYAQASRMAPGGPVDDALNALTTRMQNIAGMEMRAGQLGAANMGDPSGPTAFATAAMERGNLMRALYTLTDVLETHPDFVPAWVGLGFAQARMGQREAFLERYGTAPPRAIRKLTPELAVAGGEPVQPPPPWVELAMTCARVNLWEDAAQYLLHAGDKSGDPRLPMIIMADLAREAGSGELYFRFLQRATEEHENAAEPWLRICDLAVQSGDARAAKDAFDRAAQLGATEEELGDRRKQVDDLLETGVETMTTVS